MITRTNAFVTSDQQTFAELDAAIRHEVGLLFDLEHMSDSPPPSIVDVVMKNRDKIVDLLTTTAKSKTRARAVNGGTKKRKTTPTLIPGGPQ